MAWTKRTIDLQIEQKRVLDDLAGIQIRWEPEPDLDAAGRLSGERRRPGHRTASSQQVGVTIQQ
jgi:hypothetical protein